MGACHCNDQELDVLGEPRNSKGLYAELPFGYLDDSSGFFILPPDQQLGISQKELDDVNNDNCCTVGYGRKDFAEPDLFGRGIATELPEAWNLEPTGPNATLDYFEGRRRSFGSDGLQDEDSRQRTRRNVPESALQIKIISASGLRAADSFMKGGKSDPFCVCEIQGKARTIQTPAINQDLNPVWNFASQLPGYVAGDTLVFSVYDEDWGKEPDFLGKAIVRSEMFDPDGFSGDVQLVDAGDGIHSSLRVKISPPPRVGDQRDQRDGHHQSENDARAARDQQRGPTFKEQEAQRRSPETATQSFNIKLIGASGLRAADWNGKSDPFCTCEILNKPNTKIQSQVIKKDLNPVWNFDSQISGFVAGDKLAFRVWDEDWGRDPDFLGEVLMNSDQLLPNGFSGELELQNAGDGINARLRLEVTPTTFSGSTKNVTATPAQGQDLGRREQGRQPTDENVRDTKQPLKVKIVGARGLRAADSWIKSPMHGSKSDPYCVCEIPGKLYSKCTTPVIKKNLNPVWNFEANIVDFVPGDSLLFSVYDYDRGKDPDFLGHVTLPSEKFFPNGFAGEVTLDKAGPGINAYLNIEVSTSSPQGRSMWPAPDAFPVDAVPVDTKPGDNGRRTRTSSDSSHQDAKPEDQGRKGRRSAAEKARQAAEKRAAQTAEVAQSWSKHADDTATTWTSGATPHVAHGTAVLTAPQQASAAQHTASSATVGGAPVGGDIDADADGKWVCPQCTFHNLAPECEMCGEKQPGTAPITQAATSASHGGDHEKVSQLQNMGFDEHQARAALEAHGGDVQKAAEHLLT